ncbi:MAG: hypothetical protein ACRDTU_23205 [Micromonosporaceae bacterium]
MFKAYQHGLTYQEIAKLALIDLATTRRKIEVLSREDDIDECDEESIWVVCHPRSW